MNQKYLSIITNFGCHYNCPYCIVKNNNLKIPKTTIAGLDNLRQTIIDNDINIVSISGGGDPCYNFKKNIEWYANFFKIINGLRKDGLLIKTELHTSYAKQLGFRFDFFDRVVYHIIDLNDIDIVTNYIHDIRFVFVVTENFTENKINKIVDKIDGRYELSFRQMIDSNYNTTRYLYDFLKTGHRKKWWYIEQGDYNLYYCENKTSTKYEEFK